jgi:hypothetical protein
MKDITPEMLRYREASRTLWNLFFLPAYADSQLETTCDFFDAQRALLEGLVLRHIGHEEVAPLDRLISIAPKSITIPAMISNPRENDKTYYWDHEINQIDKNTELGFIEFFDFRDLDSIIDYQYVRCKIHQCEIHPELISHEALVEVQYVSFLFKGAVI